VEQTPSRDRVLPGDPRIGQPVIINRPQPGVIRNDPRHQNTNALVRPDTPPLDKAVQQAGLVNQALAPALVVLHPHRHQLGNHNSAQPRVTSRNQVHQRKTGKRPRPRVLPADLAGVDELGGSASLRRQRKRQVIKTSHGNQGAGGHNHGPALAQDNQQIKRRPRHQQSENREQRIEETVFKVIAAKVSHVRQIGDRGGKQDERGRVAIPIRPGAEPDQQRRPKVIRVLEAERPKIQPAHRKPRPADLGVGGVGEPGAVVRVAPGKVKRHDRGENAKADD